jgi:hypothetical protein
MCLNKPGHLKILICCLFYVNIAGAQELSNDSLNNSLDQSYPVKLYYTAIGENAHIYNGFEYMTPDRNIKGTPYFLSDGPSPSNLSYEDSYYKDFPVIYDMVRDLVVINRLGENFRISLISDKLVSFSLRKHDFIRVSQDSTKGVDLATGFYDRVYAGKSTVLVKRKKHLQETLIYSVASYEYIEEDFYFVKFGGKYVEVKNKASVLKLFNAKKSEIKSYLRKNKLRFKSDFEKTLTAASAYYDQLTS